MRLTHSSWLCDACGFTSRLYKSCAKAPPVTSRIEFTVDMMADSIATTKRDPSSGDISVDAMMLDAWSGEGK